MPSCRLLDGSRRQKTIIYFELIFLHSVEEPSASINYVWMSARPCTIFEHSSFPPLLNCVGILAENRLIISVRIYFRSLYSVPLTYTSLLTCVISDAF